MAALQSAAPRPAAQPRLWFLDNLKILLSMLVILHHAGQAYGPGGFWAFQASERWPALGSFFWVNASYFMGLFFLVSGYFLAGSYDRRGAAWFVKDRLRRFGIPLLLFLVAVNPVLMYASYTHFRGGTMGFFPYVAQIYFGLGDRPADFVGPSWPDLNFGHLWFVEHLLVYALCYAGWRLVARRTAPVPAMAPQAAPGDLALLGYALAMAAVSLIVRIWSPIDEWTAFLGFIQMEPAHLPQYLSLFVLGTVASRRGWLQTLPTARGMRWLGIGLAAATVGVSLRFLPGNLPESLLSSLRGTAECFVAVGMSVGLLTLFRERLAGTAALVRTLGADAFGAYLIHFPIVIGLHYALGGVAVGPAVKFFLSGGLGVLLSFAGSHLLRRVPGLDKVF